jgi:hypothetical protein
MTQTHCRVSLPQATGGTAEGNEVSTIFWMLLRMAETTPAAADAWGARLLEALHVGQMPAIMAILTLAFADRGTADDDAGGASDGLTPSAAWPLIPGAPAHLRDAYI